MGSLLGGLAFLIKRKNAKNENYTLSNWSAFTAIALLLLSTGVPVDPFPVEDFSEVFKDYAGYSRQKEVEHYLAHDQTLSQPWVTPYLQTPEKFSTRFGVLSRVNASDRPTSGIENWPLPIVSDLEWSNYSTAAIEIHF